MEDIIVRYLNLPASTRGSVLQDEEGNYNIYLNARHASSQLSKTLQHELHHITNNDLQKQLHIKNFEK